ncbi:uncharacterized protein LOC131947758 [Physella acuta]|uniref:uncharacterized protein LOC131947758 n=1 Tax=Physella acuta TaxID=109671 RepID=UPI0027DEAA48|nr:uncharacterized protein LOC131947758 [Physella acuta]
MEDSDPTLEKLSQELAKLTAKMAAMQADAQRPVKVEVCAPAHNSKLSVFTGLPPTGGGEVSFPEWETQVQCLLRNTSVPNPLPRVLGSLRGIAYERVKQAASPEEVLCLLQSTFGDTRCAEDRYLQFSRLTPHPRESASEFLCRLWSEMTKLNQQRIFTEADAQKKVYHTFCKGVSPLLALELRGTFGFAGEASPKVEDVLKAVKRLDGSAESPVVATAAANRTIQVDAVTAAVHQETTPPLMLKEEQLDRLAEKVDAVTVAGRQETTPLMLTEEQLDRLAEKVADILARKQQPSRGACYGCGSTKHFVRDCPRKAARQRGQQQGNASRSASGSGC